MRLYLDKILAQCHPFWPIVTPYDSTLNSRLPWKLASRESFCNDRDRELYFVRERKERNSTVEAFHWSLSGSKLGQNLSEHCAAVRVGYLEGYLYICNFLQSETTTLEAWCKYYTLWKRSWLRVPCSPCCWWLGAGSWKFSAGGWAYAQVLFRRAYSNCID